MEDIIKKFGTLAVVAIALVLSQFQIVSINSNVNKLIDRTEEMNLRYAAIHSELKSDDVIITQIQKDIERLNDRTPTVSDWYGLKNEVAQLKIDK